MNLVLQGNDMNLCHLSFLCSSWATSWSEGFGTHWRLHIGVVASTWPTKWNYCPVHSLYDSRRSA